MIFDNCRQVECCYWSNLDWHEHTITQLKETFNISKVLTSLRKDLKAASDPLVKESSARFFKEPIKSYGVKTPVARQIGKKYQALLKSQSKTTVFSICEALWKSGMMEEAIIACMFSYSIRKQFESGDFEVFEHWVSVYVTNWAACDTLCNHTIGIFLVQYPEYVSELKRWAKHNNRWMRRGAAVSLIVPADLPNPAVKETISPPWR